ncbi:malto-oligosyltrehalose trehalohydrolase [Demequina lutea]|uniref:Malto-oligosyltrehalose trehalohydrolase n=1 Tax=Demequina lutea TaxID=431489 RepID=A0A7Z0CHA7_9MICO|nr:malto-oligosyltrehalose trehalohydrolase [Demequina lutea]NYI41281.1 maltooligosyltrehalose trehalohydrolase [Demequina lutea]
MAAESPVTVWAPDASAVTCLSRDAAASTGPAGRSTMLKGAGGWWKGPTLAHGTDYAFEVDGSGPFPDPRSPWQPHGVHGFSRTFDAKGFDWTDGRWPGSDARGAVTYELHIGTFTPEGTLDAITRDRLHDLARRGIEMIELMPVAAFPGNRGWGYDGVALYAVHEAYGGPAALQRFVDSAHGEGIGVCLDVVYNHLGPDGNYLAQFGPYFTSAHETPWGWAVNLDQPGSRGMREFLIDNALRWFADFHVDALRLDAVHALVDDSPVHLLAEVSVRTAALAERLGRPLSLVAESDLNEPATITPVGERTASGAAGLGMTAQWADDVHHALHTYLTGERHGYYVDFGSIETLDKAYREVFVHDGGLSTFRGRLWGAPVPASVDRRRFVVCASNHDQVGNRALGDRPSATLSPGAQAASLALILLSPFTPMLFMGEEYGETRPFQFFTDHAEPLGSAVSEGRMSEFGGHGWEDLYGGDVVVPDPQDPETLANSQLRAFGDDLLPARAAIEAWCERVVSARALTLGPDAWRRYPVSVSEASPRQLTMTGPVTVHANLSDKPMPIRGPLLGTFGIIEAEADHFVLQPDAVALVDAALRDAPRAETKED